ncbi:chromosome segregation protein ParM [Campylobacter helveticus]|uniref:chromosome segregation protein ParM n=1 Tax=Campylobacter helveticus TaxID=28898 RepID=UPI0022EB3FE0|nr:chromosome segregation protein ParM [Campylobacter helveticus]
MKALFIATILLSNLLYASSINELNLGEVKPFAERDMLELIKEHIAKNKDEIEARANKLREQAKENVIHYKPKGLTPLKPALEDRVFYPDLTYTLNEDIKDTNGRVLYKKGFSFNPANYVKISYALVVIDGTNKKEIEWFKTSGYANTLTHKLLLSNGSFYELNKELKQEVFYLMPQIKDKFKIEKTPSIVIQEGNKIKVSEICLPCKEQNITINESLENNLSKSLNTDLNSSLNQAQDLKVKQ